MSYYSNQPSMGDIAWAAANRQKETIQALERRVEGLENHYKSLLRIEADLDFANQRLDELQSQVEALEER
jgi:polyhydroxyalkanoate synthesis regulator phasin